MTDYTETEVKLYVPYLEAVQARLETIGAALVSPRVFERNVRYDNAERSLTPAGIVLRLRQDTRARLTYKAEGEMQHGIVSRFEAEVEVSDFEAMETILGRLGYTPYMVYEKYRTTYELDGAEIVLDEMPYGNFVEIEGDEDTIEKVINRLGLQQAARYDGSYAVLFERVRRALGLTFTDLTFANFKDVDVPESAFLNA
ncbi:MAG: CYTH domain-containing protein [Chloroflexi bacterium]|jgi:adenylate cyclase class 2|nr:CYTH domain-containing protein [Chloroflexota bacterium]MDL1885421.1 CYTH domain-containing protein [Anaerolineae bacterium CFX8]GIL13261.1 MAG: hypothetical protein BroJett038_19810 [Chloroflexota bacterium]